MSTNSSTNRTTPVQRNNDINIFTESKDTLKNIIDDENRNFKFLNKKRENDIDIYKLNDNEIKKFWDGRKKIKSLLRKYSEHFNLEKIVSDKVYNYVDFLYENGLFTCRDDINSKCIFAFAINFALQKNEDSLLPLENLCEYFKIDKDKLKETAKKYYFYVMERGGLKIYLKDLYFEIKKIEKNMKIPKILGLKESLKIMQIFLFENVFGHEDITIKYTINNIACALILFEIKLYKISFCTDSTTLKTNYVTYSMENKDEEYKLVQFISAKTGFVSTKPTHFINIYRRMVEHRDKLSIDEEYKNKLINFN